MELPIVEVRKLDGAFRKGTELLGGDLPGGFDAEPLLEARTGVLESPEQIEEKDENPKILSETKTPVPDGAHP
jgi:hypothetical protein